MEGETSQVIERKLPSEGTHYLEITKEGTSQNMERKQLSNRHQPTGDHRERNRSGQKKWQPSK
jgi:hypothetical protein